MYLPPLQPVTNLDIRIGGDVEIHPTASIAPGVILQAAPNSKIIIGIDVCIGMGVIISACGGVVEIADGATLGSGVLVVGHSRVGKNTCIGTSTTIINIDVESMKTIAPGSIIGEGSPTESPKAVEHHSKSAVATEAEKSSNHSIKVEAETEKSNNQATANSNGAVKVTSANSDTAKKELEKDVENKTNTDLADNKANSFHSSEKNISNDNSHDPWEETPAASEDLQEAVDLEVKSIEKNLENHNGTAIGKVYIDQLLVTLFPHKKHS